MPLQCAFFSWWQIPAFGIVARKAKPHWDYRQFGGVVKIHLINCHPFAQPVARSIGKWFTTGMHPCAGGLASNAQPRGRRQLNNRAWLVRQWIAGRVFHTDTAFSDVAHQAYQICRLLAHHNLKLWRLVWMIQICTNAADFRTLAEP